jgi:hypothetical protein
MQVSKDIFLHKIIPYISYFELEEILIILCFKEDEIATIVNKEYARRLKCVTSEWRTIYTVDKLRHREDGPAVIWADGMQLWYQKDKLHRLDGPAVIHADGGQEYYINNIQQWVDFPSIIGLY